MLVRRNVILTERWKGQNMERDRFEHARENAKNWLVSIEEMLAAYHGDQSNLDDAESVIHDSVLSVQVRDGWRDPSMQHVGGPDEYEILLTTGGPALRIWGKLSEFCEPRTAELQMQDWGLPWTRYPAPETTLKNFAAFFWFGDSF